MDDLIQKGDEWNEETLRLEEELASAKSSLEQSQLALSAARGEVVSCKHTITTMVSEKEEVETNLCQLECDLAEAKMALDTTSEELAAAQSEAET